MQGEAALLVRCCQYMRVVGKHLTKHLLSVHDLVSAELTSGQSSNAVHQYQPDVVINDASFQSLQLALPDLTERHTTS